MCPISRQQFQLLGAVCLLLATKIRQCYALTTDLLCAYTDYSVSPDEIRVSIVCVYLISAKKKIKFTKHDKQLQELQQNA